MNNEETPLVHVDEQVVEQLTAVAGTMTAMLEKMAEQYGSHTRDLDYFREELAIVRTAIAKIAKVLHEGNGEKPLITRMALLEQMLSTHEKNDLIMHEQLERSFEKFEATEKLRREEEKRRKEAAAEAERIDKRGRWKLWVAIVAGGSSIIIQAIRYFSGP